MALPILALGALVLAPVVAAQGLEPVAPPGWLDLPLEADDEPVVLDPVPSLAPLSPEDAPSLRESPPQAAEEASGADVPGEPEAGPEPEAAAAREEPPPRPALAPPSPARTVRQEPTTPPQPPPERKRTPATARPDAPKRATPTKPAAARSAPEPESAEEPKSAAGPRPAVRPRQRLGLGESREPAAPAPKKARDEEVAREEAAAVREPVAPAEAAASREPEAEAVPEDSAAERAPGEPSVPARPGWSARAEPLEAWLRARLAELPPELRARMSAFQRWAVTPLGRAAGLGALALLVAGLAVIRGRRGPGDLVVCIEYPGDLRGSFSVELFSSRPRLERTPTGSRQRTVSTPRAHHMVARETEFRRLRPRSYWVRLEGALQDPDCPDGAAREHAETRRIDVRRRQTVRLDFDLRAQDCPVEVKVLWGGKPARDAAVASFGRPDTLRYARVGTARLELPLGAHTLAAGSGDRVAELDVELESREPVAFSLDLAGGEGLVFKGCPPAIAPYLQGDLEGAARALDQDGQAALAHLLRARMHERRGETERAAALYEAGGQVVQAAELRLASSDYVGAASLLQRTGQPEDRQRASQLLERIQPTDASFTAASRMLADLFEREGDLERARAKLEFCIAHSDGDEARGLTLRLADVVARSGDEARSLELLEELRASDPDCPEIATRIEALRKKLSVDRRAASGSAETVVEGGLQGSNGGSRYDILEQIGRGGMGIVFRARDRRLGRLVALKQLPENLRDHPTAVQLFLREARAAAALNHPNIVTLFDADEECGKFFITMELLQGSPVNTILEQTGPVRPAICAQLGLQVAAGLQYAHGQGIVHRDIKTANLFWTKDKVLKIMDFGLAKMMEEVRRSTTVIAGTPYYMAPEQSAGEAVDARADIYAFGATLFELVTGSVPFRQGDVAYHHRHTPAPDPRTLVPDLPEELSALILHMLEKAPADRCSGAAEVAERLSPLVA